MLVAQPGRHEELLEFPWCHAVMAAEARFATEHVAHLPVATHDGVVEVAARAQLGQCLFGLRR